MHSVLYFQEMQLPTLKCEGFLLRPWHQDDAAGLVKHANNPKIAVNLRDGFPYPYTLKEAHRWLAMVAENQDDIILAIELNGEAAGGFGLHGLKDVYRYNCEIGYWLSEVYWGRGIMTRAIGEMVDHAFNHTRWLRLFACIFENNPASMQVLEKNGFRKEAIHKRAVMKEGKLMDEHMYALLREQWVELKKGAPGQ